MELKLYTAWDTIKGFGLLIVPYGIETTQKPVALIEYLTFNRTLWN